MAASYNGKIGTGQINKAHTHSSPNIHFYDGRGSVSSVDLLELEKRVDKIENMLHILNTPDDETLEKYGALRTAFEKYKVLEKLILDQSKDND